MKSISRILPCLALTSLFALADCQLMKDNTFCPTDENIRVMGRAQSSCNGSLSLGFPGQEILLVFTGSHVAIEGEAFTDTAIYFNAMLDGQELPKIELKEGKFSISLAEKLDPQPEHTLRLVRRNESWQGVVRIDGFDLAENGELFPAPAAPARKLLCIGDSITCGEATEQIPPNIEPGNQNANAELSYGWQLAKRLNAQVNLVSYGGRGLMRTWDGKTDETNAPVFFERALPDDPGTVWDHSKYQPDLVTICLGQNDFNLGIIPAEEFVPAYIAFVDRVHEVYPNAKLLLISSPMHGVKGDDQEESPLRTALEDDLKTVVAHFEAQGGIDIRFHSIGWYPGTQYNAHPIAPEHKAMADELEPDIREMMAW